MKKKLIIFFVALALVLGILPMSAIASEKVIEDSVLITQWESEHPPLSDALKKAISHYKNNPCEETEAKLLEAINKAYDEIIETKINNREGYIQTRDSRIKGWLKKVYNNEWPSFMLLNTDNNKAEERQVVREAVEKYWADQSEENKATVRAALEAYYDAFLQEQEEVIALTEANREMRVAASFKYYTSIFFKMSGNVKSTATVENALAELICAYISVGAEIVYCNPEARERERELNANIYEAGYVYLEEQTEESKAAFENAIATAYEEAYAVRVECAKIAQEKGLQGGEVLLNKILGEGYLKEQLKELTEQKNLYGRIDRTVTFGTNTIGAWELRMQEDAKELVVALQQYRADKTEENKALVEAEFYELYAYVLEKHVQHLEATEGKLAEYTTATMEELLREDNTKPVRMGKVVTPEEFTLTLSRKELSVNTKLNITVKTSIDTEKVLINGHEATLTRTNAKTGMATWKLSVNPAEIGEYRVFVETYGAEGEVTITLEDSAIVKNRGKNK